MEPGPITAEVWTDYVCPWAYLGTDRTALIESLGVAVRVRSYELHPDLTTRPVPVRVGGRLAATFAEVAALASECGLPFVPPSQSASSRLALECFEATRTRWPALAADLHDAMWRGRWVDGCDLADRSVLERLTSAVGVPDEVWMDVDAGIGDRLVSESIVEARAIGIAATPTWRFSSGFVMSGVQSRSTIQRWVSKMIDRAERVADRAGHDPGSSCDQWPSPAD